MKSFFRRTYLIILFALFIYRLISYEDFMNKTECIRKKKILTWRNLNHEQMQGKKEEGEREMTRWSAIEYAFTDNFNEAVRFVAKVAGTISGIILSPFVTIYCFIKELWEDDE